MIDTLLLVIFLTVGWIIAKAFQEAGWVGRLFTAIFIAVACSWTVRDIITKAGWLS